MKFKKCPKCELNYIRIDEEMCSVCGNTLKKPSLDLDMLDDGICADCGENKTVPGEMFCKKCLLLRKRMDRENLERDTDSDDDDNSDSKLLDTDSGLDELEDLDDIEEGNDEIPAQELETINNDLGGSDSGEDDEWSL